MLAFNHLGKLGRLGNQMFQYASLRGIAANRGYDFGIPPSNFSDLWNEHQLFNVFELHHLNPSNVKFLDNGYAPVAKETTFGFDELLFNQCPNEITVWGFFQTEKYFNHIKQSIKEDFTFRQHILEPCKEMMSEVESPISLHVRRTDYTTNPNHAALDLSYYEEALKQFDSDRTVIVFSDDAEWCNQQKLFSDDRFMISENTDNAVDLCLMTMCSDHIIANSSFSWWGAWLANSGKVIAPSKWFGPGNADKSTSDLIPERWTII
jgi:Glycosyl transferase family 11